MDVTSMLQYYNTIQKATNVSGTSGTGSTTNATGNTVENTADIAESFTEMLKDQITELTDVTQNDSLAGALDGTVLSGLPNLTDLSMDMLKTSSGQKVLSELVNGQFASIVTSDSDDDDNKKTLAESVLGTQDDQSQSIDQLVKKMEEAIDTMKTSSTDTK